jgi:TetR/AcrR family transcriptional regulator, regulator of autoinduction and epiphytic fitness
MARTATLPPDPDDGRRRRLLDVALATFLRYGFRKTSMEEVARAAGLSRQGLYLHFATKDDLFCEAVRHALTTGLDAAQGQLRDPDATLEARLVGAFDAWIGRLVGALGGDVADLEEAIAQYGPLIAGYEDQFADAVARALRASPVAAAYKAAGLSARQLADTLVATGRGLKHACAARPEFRERMAIAVRAMCLPASR